MENTSRNWNTRAARLFCFCIYGAGIYALLKYILPACAPLIAAFLIGAGVFSLAERCAKWSHLPHAVCAIVILCAIALLIGNLGVVLFRYLFAQIKQLLFILSNGGAELVAARARELAVFKFIHSFVVENELAVDQTVANTLTGALSYLSNVIGGLLGKALKATPSAFITGVVSVIVCFYVAVDMRRICASFFNFIPKGFGRTVLRTVSQILPILKKFVSAYMKIYALTFAEVFLGLCIFCPRFALLGAFAVATVDILPVLGAGIVLVPWGIAELLMANYFLGVGLLLLYVVISIIRQIVEPRLLGSAVGLSPFAALLAMFAGYRIFGFLGMLLLPIALSVLKKLLAQIKTPQ